MCGGNKNSSTTSTTTTSSLPPQVAKAYEALLGFGTGVAQLPLQQYGGPRVAGFTPDEENAFQLTEQAAGIGLPYLNSAANYYGQGAAPVWSQVPQYNSANLQPYMDPWNEDVIDTTVADMEHGFNVDRNNFMSAMAPQGAFYGDRAGVAMAELMRGQSANRNRTIADLRSRGFGNAQQAFTQQQNMALQGLGADAQRAMSAAGGLGSLGQLAQGMTHADIAALLRSGALQRQVAQSQLDIPYQNFLEQQQYPWKVADFLRGLVSGTGSQGMINNSSTTTPGPSPLAQIAGLGTAGLGLYQYMNQPQQTTTTSGGGGGGFNPLQLLMTGLGLVFKKGGRIPEYRHGGAIDYDAGGVPQIDAGAFTVPEEDWYTPSSFMNPLPQFQNNTPPIVTQLPQYLQTAMSKFPNFVKAPTPPISTTPTTPPPSNNNSNWWSHLPDWLQGLFDNGGSNLPDWLGNIFEGSPWAGARGGAIPKKAYGGESLMNKSLNLTGGGEMLGMGRPSGMMPMPNPRPMTPQQAKLALAGMPRRGLPAGLPLLYAGLGIMAQESPFPGVAIGKGALSGMQMADEQRQSMDAGAEVIEGEDGYYHVYYPSTNETINTGIPYAAKAEELEIVIDDETGKPKYVKRSEALGKEPYIKAENQPTELDYLDVVNQDRAAKGLPPLTLEEWIASRDKNKATQVNIGPDGIDYGDPDPGTTWLRDPTTREIALFPDGPNGELMPRMQDVKGSEVSRKRAADSAAAAQALETKRITNGIVIGDLNRAIQNVQDNPFTNAGWFADMTKGLSGFDSFDMDKLITTITGNLGLDKLTEMRLSSATGASGLGSLTRHEMEILQSVRGSLAVGQMPEQLLRNLIRIRNVYQDLTSGGKIKTISQAIDGGRMTEEEGNKQIQAIINAGSNPTEEFENEYKKRLEKYAPRN